MLMDLNIFKEAIQILKGNTLKNVNDSLDSLRLHYGLMQQEYDTQMKELRHILVHYKKYESQMYFRMEGIKQSNIQPWVPLLKRHQQASVYPDVKVATVNQITDARKELESIGYSLNEFKFKIIEQARKARAISNDILRIEKQIFVLETAADIDGFFSESRYSPKGIAEFELRKYYDIYRKGRA